MNEVGRYYFNGGSVYGPNEDLSFGSAMVGSYLPNAWGLYDMHGNVREWCLDWYSTFPEAGNDPVGAADGSVRVLRGGGFTHYAHTCRSAYRIGYSPDFRDFCGGGFRLAAPMPAPHTVTFDLGEHGTRTGSGDLVQQVGHGATAAAPAFSVVAGWTFVGWNTAFSAITADLTVTALYSKTAIVYMVIDVSAGPEATSYPVTYLSSLPDPIPDEYKTTKVVLRHIPAGTFTMGSPEDELGREPLDQGSQTWNPGSETQREVMLTQDFYIGVFELTQRQWELVMGEEANLSAYRGDMRPVEWVSYDDLRGTGDGSGWPTHSLVDHDSFIGKLRERTRILLDLPTEAQHEYATRAGTTSALNSGLNLEDALECPNLGLLGRYHYNKEEGIGGYQDAHTTVGSYLPNAWGLYDMHGNVWERCLDWYEIAPAGGDNPVGPSQGSKRVVRNGGWISRAKFCRSATRNMNVPDYRLEHVGFRLAAPMPAPHTVTFDLGEHGTRTGGGELEQQVEHGAPAEEPAFSVAEAWTFAGWSTDFLAVSGDLTVTALYSRTSVVYMVIDVSAGPEATSYPVSYLSSLPDPIPDEYKTTKVVLRHIPAGTFIMGSPEDELGRDLEEAQRAVTLTRDFYVGVFEVTQSQWERVMSNWPSYFNNTTYRDTRPVEQVSYDDIRGSSAGAGWPADNNVDASSFLGRLRQRIGLPMDLPTEAQWEYACRAGTTTALNSGKNLTATTSCPNMAEVGRYWLNGGVGHSSDSTTEFGTAKVGNYLPNDWGLYDMHGNVWEWCLDWYATSSVEDSDPVGAASGSARMGRDGGWANIARYCRSANRGKRLPNYRGVGCGLRLAMPMPAPHTVTFDLGEHGTRTGGGELEQQVEHGSPAEEPLFHTASDWRFEGWDMLFDSITHSVTVKALFSPKSPL